MFITLSTSHAVDLLRADTDANWTHRGAFALVSHMEEIWESAGSVFEFDAVALRCAYSEYASATECVLEYMSELDALDLFADADDLIEEESVLEWLYNRTAVIQIDGYRDPLVDEAYGRLIVRSF
jgi:hypothetical protein